LFGNEIASGQRSTFPELALDLNSIFSPTDDCHDTSTQHNGQKFFVDRLPARRDSNTLPTPNLRVFAPMPSLDAFG
jgi:hypothetical protein